MKPKDIRKMGAALNREGLALRALEIAKDMIAVGSYKRAIEGAGQLKVIAQACGYDEYWKGKALIGEYNEHDFLQRSVNAKPRGLALCNDCISLSITEEEQDSMEDFRPHLCKKFKLHLSHGGDHPNLRRPAQCIRENGYEKRER